MSDNNGDDLSPKDVPEVAPPGGVDDDATAEATSFALGSDLKKAAERKEFWRRETFRDLFLWIARFVFVVAALGGLVIFGTWIWHIVTPFSLHYLSAEQVSKLEIMVFTGALASIISTSLKKYIG